MNGRWWYPVSWGVACALGVAQADDDDHAPIPAASLEQLLAVVRQGCPDCRILKMEMEIEGEAIYEVKLLSRHGQVIKQKYRAANLQLLQQKRGQDH